MLRKQHFQVSPSLKQQIGHKLWWPGHQGLTATSLYLSFRPSKRWLKVRGEHTLTTLFHTAKWYILIVVKKKKKEKKNTKKKQVKSNLKLHQIEPWGHPVHWLPDFYDHTSIFLQEQDCDTHDILSPTLLFLTELCEQLSMSINIHPQNFKWLGSISMRRWTIFI